MTLIAPGGLIRRTDTSWKQKLLYSNGIFPEWLLQYLVKKRIAPPESDGRPPSPLTEGEPSVAEPSSEHAGNDVSGGDGFDGAAISRFMPGITVAQTMAWQISRHPGFIPAFMGGLRHAPIFEQRALWSELADKLRARNLESGTGGAPAIRGGKILCVLGRGDPVIIEEEFREDATAVLGEDLVEFLVMDAGHEIVMTKAEEIAAALSKFWSGVGI